VIHREGLSIYGCLKHSILLQDPPSIRFCITMVGFSRPEVKLLSPHTHSATLSQVGLFSLPLEIRRQIYGYVLPCSVHVYLDQGFLRLSVCTEPCTSGGDGSRRDASEPWGDGRSCPIWERRLQSTWGPHWRSRAWFGSRS
jgi:hypothetical protein